MEIRCANNRVILRWSFDSERSSATGASQSCKKVKSKSKSKVRLYYSAL